MLGWNESIFSIKNTVSGCIYGEAGNTAAPSVTEVREVKQISEEWNKKWEYYVISLRKIWKITEHNENNKK